MKHILYWRSSMVVSLILGAGLGSRAAPPLIVHQPQAQTALLYEQAVFYVIAVGTPPFAYQWFRDGASIPGATNDQIVIAKTQFSDEGNYFVTVSNDEGAVFSTNVGLSVRLPQAGDPDGSFQTGGSIDGTVRSIAVQPDGRVVIAGDFTHVNGVARGAVARLNADGSTDFTFLDGQDGANGTVYSVVVLPNGKIVIGGTFTKVNGVARNNIAQLNADGSLASYFQSGLSGVQGPPYTTSVSSLAWQGQGRILVAGSFSTVNGTSCSNLARLDMQGNLDTNFQAAVPSVAALAVEGDGSVIVIAGQVLQLNPDGSLSTRFDVSFAFGGGSPTVLCLANNGDILVGGTHWAYRENEYAVVLRLQTNGGMENFTAVSAIQTFVLSLAVQSDGTILVGVDPGAGGMIVRLTSVGSWDGMLVGGTSTMSGYLYSMVGQSNGAILIGGWITGSRSGIARLNPDGTLDSSFVNCVPTADSSVNAVAVQPDGKLIVVGYFGTIHGVARHLVARLNPDGSLDTNFQDPLVSGYPVSATALQSDGRILIGGYFSTVGGETHHGIARLNADGSLDDSFQIQLYSDPYNPGPALSIVLQPDGKTLAGGTFYTTNGLGHTNIVRLNSDATVDNSFQAQALGDAIENVSQIALQADGKVLLAGGFSQVDGQPSPSGFLARVNADGTFDASFAPPALPGIPALLVQPDGKIILGFHRVNPDGSVDPSYQPVAVSEFPLLQSDGRIVLIGPTNVLRLNADGSLDSGFRSTQYGLPLAVQADGKILVALLPGGDDLQRLWGSDFPPVLKTLASTTGGEQLVWHAISNRLYRVQYTENLASNQWQNLPGDVLATNVLANKNVQAVWAMRQAFFRVQALP